MEPDDLLCSRNARPQKALVGRAQWKTIQSPSLRENERAWREHRDARSEGQPRPLLLRDRVRKFNGPQDTSQGTTLRFSNLRFSCSHIC